jgi:hypothetical protein
MAAGATYEPIATTTLGSNASSVTFSSIPQTYTDLVLVISTVPYSGSEGSIRMRFNSDSGSNYSNTYLFGDSGGAQSGKNSNSTNIALSYGNALNNPRYTTIINHIMNYSNTTTYKTVLNRNGFSTDWTAAFVSLWRNTNAISSIVVDVTYIYDIGAGSTFTLYGIKAA